MKTPILGLIAATAAFAGSAVYFWTQLQEERARAAEVTELSRRLNERVAELEAARANAESSVFTVSGGPAPPMTAGAATTPVTVEAGNSAETVATINFQGPRPELNPAYQKMMRAQIRTNNRRMYADVGEQLGLSNEEAGKLIDLLSDQQVANMIRAQETTEPEEPQQWQQRRDQQQSQIVDLLGAGKADALHKFQESMPARGEVEMIARQLEGSDAPLKDDQRKRLVAVITDERGRIPMPEPTEGADEKAFAKEVRDWQADYEQRVNAQARAILDNDQYTAYSEYQQWQKEMREHFVSVRRAVPLRGVSTPGAAVITGTAPAVTSIAVIAPAPPPETEPETPRKK